MHDCLVRLTKLGISYSDAVALRRIAMTLHNWHEKECGVGNGCIERDETTGKVFWLNSNTMRRSAIPDMETPALKRLHKIMAAYPDYVGYVQGDPRGAALYIVAKSDVPEGADIDSYYSRGVAVYK